MAVNTYGAVSVTGSATLILAANPARKGCMIQNLGATGFPIYVGMNTSVTTGNGLFLDAGLLFTDTGFQEAYRGAIYGISTFDPVDIRYWEWV